MNRQLPTQPPLFHLAHQDSKTMAEIVRRGGPREVSLKRQRGIRAQQREHEAQKAAETAHVLDELMPRLGRMPR